MTDVFISYSRRDTEFVRVLYDAFEANGKTSWVDWKNIPLTSDWWAEIEKGIEAADTFIFVISPDSIASEVCAKEILHAVQHNKRLFPIVRRDATNFQEGNLAHDAIKKHNWLMFREQDDFDKAFQQLTETISLDLEYLHRHTRLLVRAIEWSHGRSDSLLLRGDDLANAEQWLEEGTDKEPLPTELQVTYIKNSRDAQDASDRAIAILKDAERKAQSRLKISTAILSVALVLAAGAGVWATKSINNAKEVSIVADQRATLLVNNGVSKVEDLFQKNYQLDALTESIEIMALMKDLNKTNNKDIIGRLYRVISNIQERNRLIGHKDKIWGLSISPDGQRIVSGSVDGTIKLWSIEGKLLNSYKQGYKIWSVKFSNDGQLVASVDDTNSISLWKLHNDELKLIDSNIIRDLQISKQSNSSDKQIYDLAFSPDDKMIALSNLDGNLRIWQENSKVKQVSCQSEEKKENKIYNISFHPQKNIVAFGCNEGIYIWDIDKSNFPQMISSTTEVYKRNVVARFSSNGNMLATASDDNIIKIWNVEQNYKQIGEIRTLTLLPYLTDISFDNQNKFIASSHTDPSVGIKIWSLEKAMKNYPNSLEEPEKYELVGHIQKVARIVFKPNNPSVIISSSDDKTIRIWSLEHLPINQFDLDLIKLLNISCNFTRDYFNSDVNNFRQQSISKICQANIH